MPNWTSCAPLIALCLALAGCSSGVTPPGPFYGLEGPSTVGGSNVRLDLAAGGGGGGCCGWPGGAGGGGVRLRAGLNDRVELGASSLWLGHDYADFERPAGDRFHIGDLSGQLELKVAMQPGVGVVVGMGGGVTPIGAFVSPSVGLILGRSTPARIEPFGQIRLALSQPIGPTGTVSDEDAGTVEGAAYVMGSGGVLIHFDDVWALGLEAGGGFIVPRGDGELGGAGYLAASMSVTP